MISSSPSPLLGFSILFHSAGPATPPDVHVYRLLAPLLPQPGVAIDYQGFNPFSITPPCPFAFFPQKLLFGN